ncbi:hypothetical protein [Acinetobacter lanii]|uniref:Uncharacterized protein n=1 Tax=Acinetobacter lanii TaxID=2715163 RepID=A0A6G8S4D4_9GAMM|nr:hypothetical protein [Acinetobacter lanii]QIO08878.1 hypothetical protein G8D99_07520 [Acinetobacter lanii]
MLVLNLDQTTGVLYLDDVIFKYNAEADYLKVRDLLVNKLKDKLLYINGFHKYGAFDVIFCGNEFSVELVYKDGFLFSNSFIYNGLSAKKGFGATELDQNEDRKKLRKDFKKYFSKIPDKKLKNRDLYIYDWGEVRVSLSHRDYYVFLNFDYY